MVFISRMAWVNSNWRTKTGDERLTTLAAFIQELEDAISKPDWGMVGRNASYATMEKMLESAKKDYESLGGNMKRANGRTRMLRADL